MRREDIRAAVFFPPTFMTKWRFRPLLEQIAFFQNACLRLERARLRKNWRDDPKAQVILQDVARAKAGIGMTFLALGDLRKSQGVPVE